MRNVEALDYGRGFREIEVYLKIFDFQFVFQERMPDILLHQVQGFFFSPIFGTIIWTALLFRSDKYAARASSTS